MFQSNHFVPLFSYTAAKNKICSCFFTSICQETKTLSRSFQKSLEHHKFFYVAEKPVLKPKSQDNSKLDLDKPSTSTYTKTKSSVLKSDEAPIAKKVKLYPTNFDVAMYRDMVKGMSSSEICNLIKNQPELRVFTSATPPLNLLQRRP